MTTVAEVHQIAARVFRHHVPVEGPDALGRCWVCSGCQWWEPGRTFTQHLIEELAAAGIELGIKR